MVEAKKSRTNGQREQVDFSLHGVVGVRLIDPSPEDEAAIARQLGPLQGELNGRPDLVIRFVKHVPTKGIVRVELDKSGFSDEGFLLFETKKKVRKLILPFDELEPGKTCEVVCESGLHSVPYLITLVGLIALTKDYVPLHASAFSCDDTGVLVTGWAKGGKTEALLAFTLNGGSYIGDEWILLSADGEKMLGVPENIRLWDWHLEYLPEVRAAVKPGYRALFKGIRLLDSTHAGLTRVGVPLGRYIDKAMPALRRQLNVTLDPQVVFNGGMSRRPHKPDKIFLMLSSEDPTIRVEPCDPLEVARRVSFSTSYEQMRLMGSYLAFRFSFPHKRSRLIESAHELQQSLLSRALAGKEAYIVKHPYPVVLPQLYDAMCPFVSCSRTSVRATRTVG